MNVNDPAESKEFFKQFKTEVTSLHQLGKSIKANKIDKYEELYCDFTIDLFSEDYPFPDEIKFDRYYAEPDESEIICHTHIIDAMNVINSTVTIELPQVPEVQSGIVFWD